MKVGLALSGGAAYGFAHIGIIKVLEENNIPIDVISGTSMGALIGGLYATGVSIAQMEELLPKFSKRVIMDFNPLVLADNGLLFGNKVVRYLRKIVGDKKIEDCNVKYCAVASDLISAKKYVFTQGDVIQAIRASISVPGLFKPVKMGKMCLVDGGVHDNLPVEEARKLGADKVISVDVCSYYKKQNNLKSAFDILISATNIMAANLVEYQQDKGDVYIRIEQPTVSFEKFTYNDALRSLKIGMKYAKSALPEIKKQLGIKDTK